MVLFSSWFLNFLLLLATLAFFSYKYFTRNFEYWKKRGVCYPKPVPFFGNFFEVAIFRTTMYEHMKKLYDDTEEPYFGIFIFDQPILIIKSPKIIKDILIKDFSYFCDRAIAVPKHNHDIANFIFIQRNPQWKQTRAKLTPLFSTGMIKSFFSVIKETSELLTRYLERHDSVDAKVVAGQFSTEFIARCFYGIDPKCFDDEVSIFRKYVEKIFNFRWRNAIVQVLYFIKPSWVDIFKLDFVESGIIKYFDAVFKDAMTVRASYKGQVKNLIDIMNDAKNEADTGSKKIDLDVVKSNALLFMIAGQETTGTMISYTLYELALNQNIQEQLRKEIKVNVEKYGGITFEGLQEIKYLDNCINETMRKYTALPFLDRTAVENYHIQGTNLIIEKGTTIFIPYFAIQRDAKYHKNPEKYDPDRFSGNNSNKFLFLPFGEGPRSCIGKRLAMLSVATAVASVLLKFKIEKCENTPDPVKFEPKCLALHSQVGLPLKMVPL